MTRVKWCFALATVAFLIAAAILIGVCFEWITQTHPVAEALVAVGLFFFALAHD